MNNTPERDLDQPEETIRPEADYDDIRQIEIDALEVTHDFPLSTRIRAVLLAFYDDEFDVDMAIEVLKECEVVIRKADDDRKAIVDTCKMIDANIERLQNTTFGKEQGG